MEIKGNLVVNGNLTPSIKIADSVNTISNGTVVYSNANGVSFGLTGSTMTASIQPVAGVYLSSFIFGDLTTNMGNVGNILNSTSWAQAFLMPQNISCSFLRIPASMQITTNTQGSIASATATASMANYSTFNAVVYSLGTGASSQSLLSVASGSAGYTWQNLISISNSTQASYTQAYSAQANGNGTTITTQYSNSATAYSFVSSLIHSLVSGIRYIDIPFANSLSAGNYWLVQGGSTSTASGGAALSRLGSAMATYFAQYILNVATQTTGVMGSTNLTSGGHAGFASFSTAGGGTVSAIDLSQLSSMTRQVIFQLLRFA